MNPVIISPVPIILFADGVLTVKAAYKSSTGAPMQDASVSFTTANTTLACDTETVDGEIIGTLSLTSVTVGDSAFTVGDTATITVKTKENGTWSQTSFSAKTATNPTVTIATGGGALTAFPWTLTWNYTDYSGFYQNKWELRIDGVLFTEASFSKYTIDQEATIDGSLLAYAAALGGLEHEFTCELEVWSTSGLSTVVPFTWTVAASELTTTATAKYTDGKMQVECDADDFYLFVLVDDELHECAHSENGFLLFSLPTKGSRYFVVVLDEYRIGCATEIFPTGTLRSPRLDYAVDGVKQSLVLLLDNEENFDLTNNVTYEYFLGRTRPVAYIENSSETLNVSAYLKEPFDTKKVLNSLSGVEAVYRPSRGGIYRVCIDSAKFTNQRSYEIAGQLDLSLTAVTGDPYELLYDSPLFEDKQLYPAEDVYPSDSTWMVA